jgi:hypothetical protein
VLFVAHPSRLSTPVTFWRSSAAPLVTSPQKICSAAIDTKLLYAAPSHLLLTLFTSCMQHQVTTL